MVQIKVQSNKTSRVVEFEKDFGDNLEQAVALFGEKVVFSNFERMCIIDAGNKVRAMLNNAETTTEDALTTIANWKPGVSMRVPGVKKDPIASLREKIQAGTVDKDVLRAQLKEMIKSLG